MRRDGPWMVRLDEAILEHLAEHDDHDHGIEPDEVARSIRHFVTTRRVRERLRVLSQPGYVAPTSREYEAYEIASLGRTYLDGRMRADAIFPPPDPRRPGHVLG